MALATANAPAVARPQFIDNDGGSLSWFSRYELSDYSHFVFFFFPPQSTVVYRNAIYDELLSIIS